MEGTIAEIRMFGGNFAPRNWALCMGQILSIAQNTALFSLLGTTYGGNGQTTFALPDFRGRTPIGTGQGAGLAYYQLGQVAGTPSISLLSQNLPSHSHTVSIGYSIQKATSTTPVGNYPALSEENLVYDTPGSSLMGPVNTALVGSGVPFSNRSPYIGINMIVCMFGIFPSRN